MLYSAIAACLVVCLSLGLGLGLGLNKNVETPVSNTYVAMEINPSFGITADANDVVTEVKALNRDAAVVVYGEDFTGQSVQDVCLRLAEISLELGYINDGNKDITVTACNDNENKQNSVSAQINQIITQSETLSAANVELNVVSGGKSALVSAAAKMSIDVTDDMSAAEISMLVNNYDEEDIQNYIDTVAESYRTKLAELKTSARALKYALDNSRPLSALNECAICLDLYFDLNDIEGYDSFVTQAYYVLSNESVKTELISYVEALCADDDTAFEAQVQIYVKLVIKESQRQ